MNTRYHLVLVSPFLLFLLGYTAHTQDPPAQPQPAAQGVEVLTHGPVHEAFAEPTNTQPEQGPVVTKQPPEPIEEQPPEQKPEGDNVQWIPGYWAWDDETEDFIWVSGCWRDVPPGRRWVPGNWQQLDGGWVWVGGFWATEELAQVQYLPPPPPSLDQGPTSPAPDANSIYVPGCWVYQNTRYVWRPGFWYAYQPNWVWVPASYIWTPGGYLFVDGYWDHPLDQRGLLFAPALINRPVFLAARRPFVPGFAVNPDFLLGALFVRLATGHYYFGDYFDPRYAKRGFVPWPDYTPVKGAFDPTFAYYRRLHAADPQWETALKRLYTGRSGDAIPRPPRTLTRQMEAVKAIAAKKNENVPVSKDVNLTHAQNVTAVTPLDQAPKTRVTNLGSVGGAKKAAEERTLRLQALQKEEREREQKAAAVIRQGAQMRGEAEARILNQGKIPVQHTDPPNMTKLELPKLPAAVGKPVTTPRKTPPAVTVPKSEERPIPKYTPPRPPAPPKKAPPKKDKP
jgi:hypothetical protein